MYVRQYLEIFINETGEHLQNLDDCMLILEKGPDNKNTIKELFRTLHSLAGMAGIMGFFRMQGVAYGMEKAFSEVLADRANVTGKMLDLLFECQKTLKQYLLDIKKTSKEGADDHETLLEELQEAVRQKDSRMKTEPKEKKLPPVYTSYAAGRFSDIRLTEEEMAAFQRAYKAGRSVYGFEVTLSKDCLLKAARALLVFQTAAGFGERILCRPSFQEIEEGRFAHTFVFFLDTGQTLDKIMPALWAISETETAAEEITKPFLQEKKKKARTVCTDVSQLDHLLERVGELILIKNAFAASDMKNRVLQEKTEYLEQITAGIYASVMEIRMVSLEGIESSFQVRMQKLAENLNKKIELFIRGAETKLDYALADQVETFLWPLLCIAAEWDIESRETRILNGKREKGAIHLNIYKEDGSVIFYVRDDGRGAAEREAEEKTANGGAAGLKEVQNKIEALGGDMEISAESGKGFGYKIRLPLAGTILPAVITETGHEKYAIAMNFVLTVEDITTEDIYLEGQQETVLFRDIKVPLFRMDRLLDIVSPGEEPKTLKAVVVKKGGKYAAFAAERLIGQQEVVVKTLGNFIRTDRMFGGAAILGDGGLALVLDVNALV